MLSVVRNVTLLELARHMAELVPTRLLSFGDSSSEQSVGKLQIRISGKPYYVHDQRMNPLSWDIVREVKRADIIHCHQQHIAASSLAAVLSRITGRKVFVTDLGGGGWDIFFLCINRSLVSRPSTHQRVQSSNLWTRREPARACDSSAVSILRSSLRRRWNPDAPRLVRRTIAAA